MPLGIMAPRASLHSTIFVVISSLNLFHAMGINNKKYFLKVDQVLPKSFPTLGHQLGLDQVTPRPTKSLSKAEFLTNSQFFFYPFK